MSTVHVLWGEQGEYSDRRVWVVAAYSDQAAARTEAERLSAAWREWYSAYQSSDFDYDLEEALANLDPHLYASTIYSPNYTVKEVELR